MNSRDEVRKLYLQAVEIDLPFPVAVKGDIVSLNVALKKEFEIIKQTLGQLEKENQELKEENEFLETNIEEIEASNDRLVDKFLELEKIYLGLVKEYTKLDQVINILKDKIEFEDLGEMQSGNVYRGYFNDCLDEEEVNSIKEVFGNDK